ncbi:cholinesterase 1-like isoform X4 [Vanessa atalanta]|uniref:cholinesterase 1-like isoform X4 n=1 Tax=Vanessa atalanta TaxID=42275 RepID=UPI001FCDA6E5|nr:cholinesterase 1-like isoform X4 [Vanessa atalanta]
MWFNAVFGSLLLIGNVLSEETESRVIGTAQGPVRGYKDPIDDVFAYYGIPYATAPTGSQKFKAPLPPPQWVDPLDAVDLKVVCPQPDTYGILPENKTMKEDCLIASVFVPDTDEKNLPVLVNVHGGGFIIGYGNLLTPKKLVNSKRVIVVTFNYRLGPHGFLCLGTKDAPGNAGMKDQVALLRWVRANIESFGGNPHDVTISGQSAGAASVGLLMISKMARGLFNKVISESGEFIAPFSVQLNPTDNAREYAKLLNFDRVDDISTLERFYKNASYELLQSIDNLMRSDFTLLVSPCVERDIGQERFLEDYPLSILKKGDFENLPMLPGFADMEALGYVAVFDQWKDKMNTNFEEFLPADLQFSNDEEKYKVAQNIKKLYFNENPVDENTILNFINYGTDIVFACPTLRAIKLLLEAGNNQVYLYEYSYVDDTTPLVPHTKVKGANHCAQSFAVSDGLNLTHTDESVISNELKKWKITMREIWLNFITKGKPESFDIPEWLPVGSDGTPYMVLNQESELKESPLNDRCAFWEQIYSKYYRNPVPPVPPPSPIKIEL